MEEYYFSVSLDNNRTLCLAPLTDRAIELSGQRIADQSGHFLYEKRHESELGAVEIIARVISEEAVFRLRDAFKMI